MARSATQKQRQKNAAIARMAAQKAVQATKRADRAAARGTFQNYISMNEVPVRQGVRLNGTLYDPKPLARWFEHKNTVPHSRRTITANERSLVRHLATQRSETWLPMHDLLARHGSTTNSVGGELRYDVDISHRSPIVRQVLRRMLDMYEDEERGASWRCVAPSRAAVEDKSSISFEPPGVIVDARYEIDIEIQTYMHAGTVVREMHAELSERVPVNNSNSNSNGDVDLELMATYNELTRRGTIDSKYRAARHRRVINEFMTMARRIFTIAPRHTPSWTHTICG